MDSNMYNDLYEKTINPADLLAHNNQPPSQFLEELSNGLAEPLSLNDLSTVDSAIDLTNFSLSASSYDPSSLDAKTQYDSSINALFDSADLAESSQPSNTPSPGHDMIFSQSNSPRDFFREQGQNTTRETSTDSTAHDVMTTGGKNTRWDSFTDPFTVQQQDKPPVEPASVYLHCDKTKTRAETQIKVTLKLDPVADRFQYIQFDQKNLAKPKHLASHEERKDIVNRGEAIFMKMLLVCVTAMEKEDGKELALRRARDEVSIPRRPSGKNLSDIDKDDPAHPQNGGEILICQGCKERERKRHDRKKKKTDDEAHWWSFEADRVVMINEKEFKKFKEPESDDEKHQAHQKLSKRAKEVDFALRIACYCRHQEEKSPSGYRVIFTFKDESTNSVIAQHISEIFHITDDHKNKEVVPEAAPRPLHVPQQTFVQTAYAPQPAPIVVPNYNHFTEPTFAQPSLNAYSTTPVMGGFTTSMSPIETQFPQSVNSSASLHRQMPSFSTGTTSISAPHFPRPQPTARYDVPMMSPTGQFPTETAFLTRPVSMENFNFALQQAYQYPHHGFASAPPTPLSLSRPPSPTWEQGPLKKKPTFYGPEYDD